MSHPTSWHLVVTGAKSRTHLVYVASYVRWLLARSDVDEVRLSFLESGTFLAAPSVTVDDAREVLPHDPRLDVVEGMAGWRFSPGWRAVYVAVGAPGLKAWTALRRANLRRPLHVVVTDEGIGTYGTAATRRAALIRQGSSEPSAIARSGLLTGASWALTSQRWPSFRQGEVGWKVSSRVADEFRRRVPGAAPRSTRDAVILTQPFVDMGLICEADHRRYVERLAQAATDAGLRPVVRPHPAERRERYAGLEVMAARGTAELDPDVVRAALVMGGPSTALVNLSAMYGAPVVWSSADSLRHLDRDVSSAQAGIFSTFLGRPHPAHDLGRVVEALTHVDGSATPSDGR